MRKVTLRFPDEASLQQFASTITDKFIQISFEELLVTCNCEEVEVELAVNGFHAVVVNKFISLD